MNEQVQLIERDRIVPSPLNPRKVFPVETIADLARSIAEVGLLVPLIVRPIPDANTFELCDGERRWRAAEMAGINRLPCLISEMNDQELIVLAVTSFIQREDLGPMEQAAALQLLIDQGKTVEDIARAIGKSESTVRGLLRLTNLPARAQDALKVGMISPAVAGLIASRPSAEMREQVMGYALVPRDENDNEWEMGELPSFRRVKEWIGENLMRELKGAPFSQTDKTLLPEAGSCKDCPKRTGNTRDQYPEGRADICTDMACYDRKVKAWGDSLLEKAAKKGQKVLDKDECAALFKYGDYIGTGAGYYDLAEQCAYDLRTEKVKTWQDVFGPHIKDEETVLARDPSGNIYTLLPKQRGNQILGKFQLKAAAKSPAKSQNAADAKKHKAEQDKREAQLLAEVDAVVQRYRAGVGKVEVPDYTPSVLDRVIIDLFFNLWGEPSKLLKLRWAIKDKAGDAPVDPVLRHLATLTEAERLIALVEIQALKAVCSMDGSKREELKTWFPRPQANGSEKPKGKAGRPKKGVKS